MRKWGNDKIKENAVRLFFEHLILLLANFKLVNLRSLWAVSVLGRYSFTKTKSDYVKKL